MTAQLVFEVDVPLVVQPTRPRSRKRPVTKLPAGKPLTLNQHHNPFAKAKLVEQIREGTGWAALAAMKRHRVGRQDHITVQLHYRPGDRRRRDTDNLIASQKPAVDGLVDARLIPDDNPSHLTWFPPEIHTDPGPRRLWLEIRLDQPPA
ncbi:hypothetical protein [Amycolatopsis sp. NPDC006125]|uniref:hypothetical protein n=1 Tax=Amycolatopsis sp. NPDC006125 TaxID=3156730 RepID=UPI0033BE0F65